MNSFTTGTATKVTVGSTSTKVLDDNLVKQKLILTNDSDEVIYVNVGAAAVANQGIRLNASGGQIIFEAGEARGEIYAICASGSKNLAIFYA